MRTGALGPHPECSGSKILLVGAGADAVDGVLKNLQGLRNEMAHLCTNLQAYLMFEVLERAWTQFTTRVAAAPDLDSLISALPLAFVLSRLHSFYTSHYGSALAC